MSVVGIVPAGGSGERLGADRPKAFVVCAGRPLIEWSLDVLGSVCDRVVVAAPDGYDGGPEWVPVPEGAEAPTWVRGGESRSASVRNAVQTAPEAMTFVIHDAARPLVTRELVERCMNAIEPGIDGAIAAVPMTDTVKEVAVDRRVLRTLDRSALWAVQTPQVFRADILRRALERDAAALAAATDDAWLVDDAGGVITVVESFPENIKVTRESDLRIVEALLAH
jgi:2-C-methyl-D-erythritol 4-phosphate cytidylyltransferase